MKTCHVCNAVCEDYAELCPVCGADLTYTTSENEEINTEIDEISNPVLLATIEDVVSAEIFGDILTDNGVLFSSSDEAENGGMKVVFGGGFASVDIYVDEKQFEIAEKLYEEFLESENSFDEEFFIEESESSENV